MKVMQSGLFAKDINIRCERCECIYALDDYNDWSGEWYNIYHNGGVDKIYKYETRCPECNYLQHFGCNYQEVGLDLHSLYDDLFAREDWSERYSMVR